MRRPQRPPGLLYLPGYVAPDERVDILDWLAGIHPIWEDRYSRLRPPPDGQAPRALLRPVYWLGNWQFACLDYYRPPHGTRDRCVRAEAFPPVLARIVRRVEALARDRLPAGMIPPGWRLDTCLVNLYGDRVRDGKREDVARVGEHKDFEPGPVASVSLGERALFQFVRSRAPGSRDAVALQMWLEDSSLQLFAGDAWKKQVFHRVQRVERRAGSRFAFPVEGFETRRVNFTFRHVPDAHVVRFRDLAPRAREDVRGYVAELARHSPWFAEELRAAGPA